tara:strand:+ start:1221 stop:1433 length:213 start_codon:yes stop_codon:yes gene_type:complete
MTWKEVVKADSDESSDKRELAERGKLGNDLITQLSLNIDMLKEMKESGVDAFPPNDKSKKLLDFLKNWWY